MLWSWSDRFDSKVRRVKIGANLWIEVWIASFSLLLFYDQEYKLVTLK